MLDRKKNILPPKQTKPLPTVEPKTPFVTALTQFAGSADTQLRAIFDESTGHLRSLTTEEPAAVLWAEPLIGTPAQHAQRFLNVGSVRNMLDLKHACLRDPEVKEVAGLGGYRASFQQEVTASDGRKLRVRNGFVDVVMNEEGHVISLHNELRHGERQLDLSGIVDEKKALAAAKKHLGWTNCDIEKVELVASAYDRESTRSERIRRTIGPVYEVVLSAPSPRRSMFVLVTANEAEVVHQRSLTHNIRITVKQPALKGNRSRSRRPKRNSKKAIAETAALVNAINLSQALMQTTQDSASGNGVFSAAKPKVKGHAFLCVPDPNKDVTKQYYKVVLESLTDGKALANENFKLYIGNKRSVVKAKNSGADAGTFNYKPYEPEFAAVATMFALNIQWELLKKWGMKVPEGTPPTDVRVENRSVVDNAQFDQVTGEITIGVGTGVAGGGLTTHIAYDIGVSWHENGHHFVFIVTPGNDLGGVEGAAGHEAVGDIEGLRMDWWFRFKFAASLGVKITKADILKDPRIVGMFAAPPNGIRQQKNTAKPPLSGEAHDDSLIVGGAMADAMVDFVQSYDVEKGLENFGKLLVAALAIVPRHKVRFRDLLNALITADGKLFNGANKAVLVKRFDEHGIRLTGGGRGTGGSGGSPVIIIVN